jgi:23S rRNA (cytosine1962-C5)-methyltransferase
VTAPSVILRAGRDARVRAGHLWVYGTDIDRTAGRLRDGDAVVVRAASGAPLGTGLVNSRSAIAVRLLSDGVRAIDERFIAERLQAAIELRERIRSPGAPCRLVYSEADGLPGLIVDRYADLLVLQTLTLGMDLRKAQLVRLLAEMLHPRGIYERNDPAVRRLEGLPGQTGWLLGGGGTEVEIEEAGARFAVDVARGQKTGFFLDQRENRLRAAALLAPGARVLDAFAYTGAWGIQAVLGGAEAVVGIEISAGAAALAERNAALNGCAPRCRWLCENAFDALRRMAAAGPAFDLAVLDPPAFVKTRAALARGLAGYKEINLRALRVLRRGGWLVSCSCSFHVDEPTLISVVWEAARDAGRKVRIIESRSQAPDHPVHPAMPETRYLKCLIAAVE